MLSVLMLLLVGLAQAIGGAVLSFVGDNHKVSGNLLNATNEEICEDLREQTRWPTRVLCGRYEIKTYGWDVYNARCASLTPRFIVVPATVADAQAAVRCAVQYGVRLSYRSGGHSYNCNSFVRRSMNLDLRQLGKEPVLSKVGDTTYMTFFPGTRAMDMKYAVEGQNLNFRYGSCDSVGAMGYHLHGGWNKISEKWANESITSIDVITATGDLVTVGEDSTGDDKLLFDGMRIAGSSYGIATAVTIELENAPLPGLLVFMVDNTFEELLAAMVKQDWGVVGFLKHHQLYKYVIRSEGRTDRYFLEVMLHDWEESTMMGYFTWMMTYGIRPIVNNVALYNVTQYWVDTVTGVQPQLPSYNTGAWKYGQAPFEDIGIYMRFYPDAISLEVTKKLHDEFYQFHMEECSIYFGGKKHIQDPFIAVECRTPASIALLKQYIIDNTEYYQPNRPGSGYSNVPLDQSRMWMDAFYPTYKDLQAIKDIWDPTNVFKIRNGIHPTKDPIG